MTGNADSTVPNADRPEDLEQLEHLISSDEAEMKERQTNRDEAGKFRSANAESQRAGSGKAGRQTPEVLSAKAAKAAEAAASGAPATDPKTEQKPPPTDDATAAAAKLQTEAKKEGEAEGQTPYQKAKAQEKAREARAWKEINDEKARLEIERQSLAAERRTKPKPAAASANGNGAPGYTAAQYTHNAEQWDGIATRLEAKAKQLEDEGDFEKADTATQQAAQNRALARAAREAAQRAPAHVEAPAEQGDDIEAATRQAWATVKTDLPEALVQGSPMNAALIEYIRSNPGVLNAPGGVYRAVIQTGRSMVAKLERELGQVPTLRAALTAEQEKVKALEKQLQDATSLPGGGGNHLGASSHRSFGELPAAERERQLEADMAGMV